MLGLVCAAVIAFPLYWMVLSAVKPEGEVQSLNPRPWTLRPALDSFQRLFSVNDFGRYFLNSVIVAVVVVVLSAGCAFLAATALTRFRFRLRGALLVALLVAQMIPVESLTIPLFFLIRNLGDAVPPLGLNQLGALVLVHLGLGLPFTIWMLRGFVRVVPEELEEAAYLDGASRWQFLTRILFPLVAPGLVATSVFSFINAWNDFLFAKTLIISAPEQQTLPMSLLVFMKVDQNDWGAIMAGSTIMTIPVLVFFLLVQRHLVAGTAGAVKG
ncbi:carbohydrate ABC transporter permease [Goodfellowiella coeruleoviolacea]|uniref:carbohydrate ABC transporter permease n=1 Tax=Goodfellowiella coeruleoviolacea TaxID=334858 RepID=UPI000AECD95F|nr:carbohydrate ABC transporter permease [Goodfellowiella coeruleoviolacea]